MKYVSVFLFILILIPGLSSTYCKDDEYILTLKNVQPSLSKSDLDHSVNEQSDVFDITIKNIQPDGQFDLTIQNNKSLWYMIEEPLYLYEQDHATRNAVTITSADDYHDLLIAPKETRTFHITLQLEYFAVFDHPSFALFITAYGSESIPVPVALSTNYPAFFTLHARWGLAAAANYLYILFEYDREWKELVDASQTLASIIKEHALEQWDKDKQFRNILKNTYNIQKKSELERFFSFIESTQDFLSCGFGARETFEMTLDEAVLSCIALPYRIYLALPKNIKLKFHWRLKKAGIKITKEIAEEMVRKIEAILIAVDIAQKTIVLYDIAAADKDVLLQLALHIQKEKKIIPPPRKKHLPCMYPSIQELKVFRSCEKHPDNPECAWSNEKYQSIRRKVRCLCQNNPYSDVCLQVFK